MPCDPGDLLQMQNLPKTQKRSIKTFNKEEIEIWDLPEHIVTHPRRSWDIMGYHLDPAAKYQCRVALLRDLEIISKPCALR
jgi:hypothetical protein